MSKKSSFSDQVWTEDDRNTLYGFGITMEMVMIMKLLTARAQKYG